MASITLLANGYRFDGWLGIAVNRHIDRCGSHFEITMVHPQFAGDMLQRFMSCQVLVDDEVVITGYIDDVAPSLAGHERKITISGRSKTADLIDCTPDVPSGQYRGYTLEAITRSICGLFGIGVTVQTDATQIFPDATLQRGERAFAYLERLGRLAGVLLTDNAQGNLLLATTGTQRAAGSLVEGRNILRASAKLSGAEMYSQYIVKGQRALGSAAGGSETSAGAGDDTEAPAPAAVVTNLRAVATDPTVPRYRPKISMAEAQLDLAGMQRRANWERNYAFGRSTSAEITVHGWRDGAGALWEMNKLIAVHAPWLGIDQDLLIAGVTFDLSEKGMLTTLRVGPPAGFTPDPGQVKLHTKKGRGAAGVDWHGAGGYQ